MAKPPRDCPCTSGKRYKDCCANAHAGAVPAATPEALMRSRFSAFALGLGEYLIRTLANAHPDRALPHDEHARELSRAKDLQRFLGLRVLRASQEGDAGEVLFHARVFSRGEDLSFAELSTFVREDGTWRYASGLVVHEKSLPKDLTALDRASFLALTPIDAMEERDFSR